MPRIMVKLKSWAKKLLLVLIATLCGLALTELLVRGASKYSLHLFDVEMWRYASEVKRESKVPGVVERHQPDSQSHLMGVQIRTDSSGFRRPDPLTESLRTPDNLIAVALGDSLTLGWGVPEDQTYPAILERILGERARQSNTRAVTVVNAGIGNSNTSMELARYEQDIRPLHPHWLILGFFINDAEPDPQPVQNAFFRNSALISLVGMRLKPYVNTSVQNYNTYYRALYEEGSPGWKRFQQALAKLGRNLQEDNVKATIVLLPEMHEPLNFGPFGDVYHRVASLAASNGFEVIDASPEFPSGPGNQFWVAVDDAHPNAQAQKLFAMALAKSRYASVNAK
jgi:lysophospholipase L1-like esterase